MEHVLNQALGLEGLYGNENAKDLWRMPVETHLGDIPLFTFLFGLVLAVLADGFCNFLM